MLRKGQMGPQGLEDLPMAVMAFIVAVCAVIIFLRLSAGHLEFSGDDDMHAAGKRLLETLSNEVFKSPESRVYGDGFIDWETVLARYTNDSTLKNVAGSVEHNFWARVSAEIASLDFGEEPPDRALAYGGAVSVLYGNRIYNGKIEVKIWQ